MRLAGRCIEIGLCFEFDHDERPVLARRCCLCGGVGVNFYNFSFLDTVQGCGKRFVPDCCIILQNHGRECLSLAADCADSLYGGDVINVVGVVLGVKESAQESCQNRSKNNPFYISIVDKISLSENGRLLHESLQIY